MAISSPELLRPSPLDLGATLSGAFRVLRHRLSKFVVIALLQGVVTGLLIFGALVAFVFGIVTSVQQQTFAPALIVGVAALFVAVLCAVFIQIKTQAMLVLGAHDTIEGRDASIGQLFGRTRGVVGRMMLLVLAVVGGFFALFAVFGGFFWGLTLAAARSDDPGAAIGALVGLYLLFVVGMLAIGVAAVYFQVRFFYLMPALAVEGRPAIDALKRSWGLTRGQVLRTLGYYLVASFLVSAVSYVFQIIPQMVLTPAIQLTDNSGNASAVLIALIPFLALVTILQIAVQLLAVPFLACYVTVMYVDQLRRNALPPGYRPFPGQPVQRPQQWGQPGPHGQWQSGPTGQSQQPGQQGTWGPVQPNPPQPPHGGSGPQQWGTN